MLHIQPTNLLLLAGKQEPYKKKAYLLTKTIEEFCGKSSREWASRQKKKDKTETAAGVGRGDRTVEPNDSPEIPDRRETSDIPGLPSGGEKKKKKS